MTSPQTAASPAQEPPSRQRLRSDFVWGGETGEAACDHYHRYLEDIALMRSLGIKAYRLSIAWPRVLPTGRGAVDEAGHAFYDRLVDGLLDIGIEPGPCLYHRGLPQALLDLGDWTDRDSVAWFSDYARLAACRLGDRVKRLMTFGIIHNLQPSHPVHPTRADRRAAALLDDVWNKAFADPPMIGDHPPSLRAGIDAMAEAVARGADVRGCFVWSLLDNFEWGAGYAIRFGPIYVADQTQGRILKASARWYATLIKAHARGVGS